MTEKDDTAPYLYQAWKHHLPFLKERLAKAANEGTETASIAEGMKKMGDSVTDLYTGDASVERVLGWIEEKLGKELLCDPSTYRKWLGKTGYRTLTLPDRSKWVLKQADGDRWLHLHPARSSPHSVRVKGKTLRTAFLVCLEAGHYGISPLSKELVDRVRTEQMGLPPIRSLERKKGLGRIIELLRMS